MEKRSYNTKELVLETYKATKSVSETAQKLSISKGAVYQAVLRCGEHVKKPAKTREAAEYSATHSIREAAEKFGMKIEAIHYYRCKYKIAQKRDTSKLT